MLTDVNSCPTYPTSCGSAVRVLRSTYVPIKGGAVLRKKVIGGMALLVTFSHGQRADLQPSCHGTVPGARRANTEALQARLERRLDEASLAFKQVINTDRRRAPTEAEVQRVLRFAPRTYTTRSEPFGLLDVVAVVHPNAPWIAYHFFWEDDIDFPDDNDPCDHELIWVMWLPNISSRRRY